MNSGKQQLLGGGTTYSAHPVTSSETIHDETALGSGGCRAQSDALTNQGVLAQLFRYLDTKTLIHISLVSKIWCTAARSALRSTKCLAGISGTYPCQELLLLNDILSKSTDPPYTGLEIRTRPRQPAEPYRELILRSRETRDYECSSASEDEGIDESGPSVMSSDSDEFHPYRHRCVKGDGRYSAIFDKIKYDHLELHWVPHDEFEEEKCPVEDFLVRVLKEKGDSVRELKVTAYPTKAIRNRGVVPNFDHPKEHWLPNLTVLDIGTDVDDWSETGKYHLFAAAPNLQTLRGTFPSHYHAILADLLSRNKTELITDFMFTFDRYSEDRLRISKPVLLLNFALLEPRLKKFAIKGFTSGVSLSDHEKDEKILADFLVRLLTSSSSSLEELRMNQVHFLYPFGRSLREPLINVHHLSLDLLPCLDEKKGLITLERFDWPHWFPSLKTIDISRNFSENWDYFDHYCYNPFFVTILRGQLLQRPISSPCATVTNINFLVGYERCAEEDDFPYLRCFPRLFPNVKNFTVIGAPRLEKMLKFLWVAWPDLETITLKAVKFSGLVHNVDSVFCGITKEQSRTFWKETFDSLKTVEVRSEEPSILSLKRLKKLYVNFLHRRNCDRKLTRGSNRFFLTHVAAAVAFTRMPGLQVTVEREVCKGSAVPCGFTFEHLRPFVKLYDSPEHQLDEWGFPI